MAATTDNPRSEKIGHVVVGIITSLLITVPGVTVGHVVTVSLLEERVTVLNTTTEGNGKSAKANADRIAKLETLIARMQASQEALDKNVKIAANEAKANGEKIDEVAKDLNRLIGAFESQESRRRR